MDSEASPIIESKNEELVISDIPSAKKKKYLNVLDEIVETEEAYLSDVEKIINGYIKKIQSSKYSEIWPKIFGNFEEIFSFHQKLLPDIKRDKNDVDKFSNIFITLKDKFVDIYANYCTNYVGAIEELSEHLKSKEFSDFISAIQIELNHKLPLSTFLLKPVQRILKYQLLLRSLGDSLKKESLPFEITNESAQIMAKVAARINEVKKETEENNRYLFYKQNITNLDNFEIKSSGKYIEEFNMIIKEEKHRILIFERYLIIMRKEEDQTFSALYLFPLRQADINIDKKKLKQIELELDNLKITLRAKDKNEAQRFISTVIKMKKSILEILKAGNQSEIDKITFGKIEISKIKKSNTDLNSNPTRLSNKLNPADKDFIGNKNDELNPLKNKSLTENMKPYLGFSLHSDISDAITKSFKSSSFSISPYSSISEDALILSKSDIKKYSPVPFKDINNPIIDSFVYVNDSPCQEIQYILEKVSNLVENEKAETSITEKVEGKVELNRKISLMVDSVKHASSKTGKSTDQDNYKPLISAITKSHDQTISELESDKTTKGTLSEKLNTLNISKQQKPIISNIIDLEKKRPDINLQESPTTILNESNPIYDNIDEFDDDFDADFERKEYIINSNISNVKEINNNSNRAETDKTLVINKFKIINNNSDLVKGEKMSINNTIIQDNIKKLDDLEKIYQNLNFKEDDYDEIHNEIDKNISTNKESCLEDRNVIQDLDQEKSCTETKMVKFREKNPEILKNETLDIKNTCIKRGEGTFTDLFESMNLIPTKKIENENYTQENINRVVDPILKSEPNKNEQTIILNNCESPKNESESIKITEIDPLEEEKIYYFNQNYINDKQDEKNENNIKIEQTLPKVNNEMIEGKISQPTVSLGSAQYEIHSNIVSSFEQDNFPIINEIAKNDLVKVRYKPKILPSIPVKKKLPPIPNKNRLI